MRRALVVAVALGVSGLAPASPPAYATAAAARSPVEHFIFLLQGERTFDNYFGTFPGADGLPARTCQLRVVGQPAKGCVRPFALHGLATTPMWPSESLVTAQINRGRMDGFVTALHRQGRDGTQVMGYYDERDLPFAWEMAREYVLFDRFFASAPYGSSVNQSYWVAAAPIPTAGNQARQPTIFDRLQRAGVSWKLYVQNLDASLSARGAHGAGVDAAQARIPLLRYDRFRTDPALRSRLVDLEEYYRDLDQGTLPAVSYVVSSGASERTARSMPAGQRLARTMIRQLMASRFWDSSAFLWSYAGSGGWYDHVAPPLINGAPAGLRVPAVLVSPYARAGQVNHSQLDYASALRFIEQNWSVAPLTARDASATSLDSAFDFTAPPRPPQLEVVVGEAPRRPVSAVVYGAYGAAVVGALLLLGVAVRRSRSEGLRS